MLVGSKTTPLGDTPLNILTSARRRTAATTLRLAWNYPLSYPVHPLPRRPMTCTSSHKSILTPCLNHQSSIYAPSIDHKDLAHIPDPSSCRQAGLSICQTYRLPNLRLPFQSLAQRLQAHQQCCLGRRNQSLPPTTTLTRYSFAPSRTDSSPRSPTTKPTQRCNFIASQNKSKVFKTASSHMSIPSREPP